MELEALKKRDVRENGIHAEKHRNFAYWMSCVYIILYFPYNVKQNFCRKAAGNP